MYSSKQARVPNLNGTGHHTIAYQEWPRLIPPPEGALLHGFIPLPSFPEFPTEILRESSISAASAKYVAAMPLKLDSLRISCRNSGNDGGGDEPCDNAGQGEEQRNADASSFSPLQVEESVVLCMHGLTRNSHDFDFLAAKLAADHAVIAPSMAGRGDSEWLQNKLDYHYGTYLADTMSLLDQLHLQTVLWVGTSMGGILGMMAASMYPGRVKALVLNDVGMKVPKEGLQRIAGYAGSTHVFASQEEARIFLKDIFASFGINDPAHWDHLVRHSLIRREDGKYILACDPDILLPMAHQTEWFKMIQDVDLSLVWYGVQCPVLILRGKESDILTKDTADIMAAGKPNVTLVEFDGTGHAPALMSDEQISVIVNWLKRFIE